MMKLVAYADGVGKAGHLEESGRWVGPQVGDIVAEARYERGQLRESGPVWYEVTGIVGLGYFAVKVKEGREVPKGAVIATHLEGRKVVIVERAPKMVEDHAEQYVPKAGDMTADGRFTKETMAGNLEQFVEMAKRYKLEAAGEEATVEKVRALKLTKAEEEELGVTRVREIVRKAMKP